ncbi:hypothetical protein OG239_16605 [Streptomyces sp. NBC_00868]|uniref:hypothetical protein n=1 Tax=unclassified Streptomyces TaxID=2593676 RepID=UPI003253575E|nr:hypothetical protein OG239_16605 [Streptomyces sp. NBC_00868]
MSSTKAASPSRPSSASASPSVTAGSVSVMASAYSMTWSSSSVKASRWSRHCGTWEILSSGRPSPLPSQWPKSMHQEQLIRAAVAITARCLRAGSSAFHLATERSSLT